MKPAFCRAWRQGGVVTLLALCQHAYAAAETPCSSPVQESTQAEARARAALPQAINLCIRDVHQGRAAVLLPAADLPVDDAALAPGLSGHRWGFLDSTGQLAIRPVFDQVSDYHHDLAAASQKGKWGYIDLSGKWAIAPQFDSAADFTQPGVAVVSRDGRPLLINRSGAPLGQPFDDLVESVSLQDGTPLQIRLTYRTVFISPDGQRHFARDQMEIVQPFGDEGLFIARNSENRYGIADPSLTWRIAPQFSAITVPPQGHGLARAEGAGGITFIRADGSLVGKTYRAAEPLTRDIWQATQADGRIDLLDSSGNVMRTLPEGAVSALSIHDRAVLERGKGPVSLYLDGRQAPVSLPQGSTLDERDTLPYLVTLAGPGGKISGVIAPDGTLLANAAWLGQAASAELINGRLWLRDARGKLLNVIDPQGKALLNARTLEALDGHPLQPLYGNDRTQRSVQPDLPLARLDPVADGEGNAGLLRADGSLLQQVSWLSVSLADGADAGADAGAPLQFIVTTQEGMGLVDSQGQQRLPFGEENISSFVQGYAFVYRDGTLSALDHQGKRYALPDEVQIESIGGGWFRFRDAAAEDAPWGIFDALAQRVVAAPVYRQVGLYANGQADVQQPNGRWGVINSQNSWVIAPDYAALARINPALWFATLPAPAGSDAATTRAVIGADGQPRVPPTSGLTQEHFSDGRILASAPDGQSWLLSAEGNPELNEQDTTIRALGDWVKLSRLPQEGYLNAQGSWQIAADGRGAGSAFINGRALRAQGQLTEVVDAQGTRVGTLPGGQWYWPAASEMSFSILDNGGQATTRYADTNGRLALTVTGQGSRMTGGRAVLAVKPGDMGWIDAKGQPLGALHYQDLGLPVDGLAFAKTAGHYGFVDAQGNFVIPPVFDAVSPFEGGAAIVSDDTASMMIDSSGKLLARVGRECGVQVLYGRGSERQWPLTLPVRCGGTPPDAGTPEPVTP
ncbi:hypothetical protein CYR55_01435 [Chimaeribacter californicus]|uniref:WG repeat-containing protein n=1 Tax=Chimaeribacter californicus TaxID=2060067 RepID=A0A2N5EG46_9GAMM|nr:WG repeat-containing protein [Chimaeribacter californicus]PLR41527.1 hypothetical protein CYR55_01435 [Chimaeribacter californicus]